MNRLVTVVEMFVCSGRVSFASVSQGTSSRAIPMTPMKNKIKELESLPGIRIVIGWNSLLCLN